MKNPGPVAIVGAGIAGLSCARALVAAGLTVHLFEKETRVGGRCATRLWQGHLVDYGVPFFTAETAEFKRELLVHLRQFRPLVPPILDASGKLIHSGDGPRFYVLQGNNYFAHVLSHRLILRMGVEVEKIKPVKDGFECAGTVYRTVISAVSGSQTAALFDLEKTEEASRLTVVLQYRGLGVGQSENCYAHALAEDAEPLVATYCENHKISRVVGDKTVFVLQAGPKFSEEHAEEPLENYLQAITRPHEELWKIRAGQRTAAFSHRWRVPKNEESSAKPLNLPPGSFMCGEWRASSSVEQAWLGGQRTASAALAYFSA